MRFLLSVGANPGLIYTFNGKNFTPEQYINSLLSNSGQLTSADMLYLSEAKVAIQKANRAQLQKL